MMNSHLPYVLFTIDLQDKNSLASRTDGTGGLGEQARLGELGGD